MYTRCLVVCAALLTLGACAPGGSGERLQSDVPDALQLLPPSVELGIPEQASLAEQLVDSAVPTGVDPELYAQLRDTLASAARDLPARSGGSAGPTTPGPQRRASFTPYGWVNRIDDLVLSGTGPYRLSWTYRNRGDYDLNGMVNVSDLTPIGVYYGLASSEPRWLIGSGADGDGNGMITISDITPIGQYFAGTIIGYQVWGTDDPAGDWTHVGNATVETNLNKNPLRPRFVVQLPSLDYAYYSIWPYDNSDDEGWWSNITSLDMPPQRHIVDMERPW